MPGRAQETDAPVAKKRKVTKSGNAPRRQPSREQLRTRVALYERANSDRSQNRGTPVFHQPHSPQPPSRRRQAAAEDEDQDLLEIDPEPGTPKADTYGDYGRKFALKIWPWPSSSWWVGDSAEEQAAPAPRSVRGLSEEEKKLEEAKRRLDTKIRAEFLKYVRLDLDLSDEVWKTKKFRAEVTVLCVRCTLFSF